MKVQDLYELLQEEMWRKSLPIGSIGPSHTCVRVGIKVSAIIQLRLGRLLKLVRVCGEGGNWIATVNKIK